MSYSINYKLLKSQSNKKGSKFESIGNNKPDWRCKTSKVHSAFKIRYLAKDFNRKGYVAMS